MRTGIILLGGKGSRLSPQSNFVNKHLNQLYDKPLFFYSLTTLILSGIDELVLCCNKNEKNIFDNYANYLTNLGLKTNVCIQPLSQGIPSAIYACSELISQGSSIKIILGDNLLVGNELMQALDTNDDNKAYIFTKKTSNMESLGVLRKSSNKKFSFIEKPNKTLISDRAIIGLYILPYKSLKMIKNLKKSKRGETEIIDLVKEFYKKNLLAIKEFGRGVYWSDVGSHESFVNSSILIKNLKKAQMILLDYQKRL